MNKYFGYVAAFFFVCCYPLAAQDPVRNAIKQNEEKADDNLVDEDVAEFIVRAAEGRLIIINEAKLAVLKGTTSDVRNYGQMMIKDQTMMLEELKKISAEINITLPDGVSDKKREEQMELSEAAGEDFDKKFIKMIETGLERDIKLFEKAHKLTEPGIRSFVENYVPTIQSHMQKVQAIRDQMPR